MLRGTDLTKKVVDFYVDLTLDFQHTNSNLESEMQNLTMNGLAIENTFLEFEKEIGSICFVGLSKYLYVSAIECDEC